MTNTGLVTSPLSELHQPGSGHPERAERLTAIMERLAVSGMLSEMCTAEADLAPTEALLRIHPQAYLNHVETTVASGSGYVDSTDANVCVDSYRAARAAAGGALSAVDRVLAGEWDNAFVAVRPPGHHAEASLAMGFCLLNSAAIAVRHAQAVHGLERVAVVDWDVHHGNGTQHLFEADGSVLYASLHQYPHYPGTGAASERGRGEGQGATLNCPQPAGSGDADWLADFEEQVLPRIESFDPQLVIISAGFDAHALDPLSDTRLTEEAYRVMTRGILDLAREHCAGRVVSLLEGGYSLSGLARSVEAHVGELRVG